MSTEAIVKFVQRVQEHVEASANLIKTLRPNVAVSHPIPFFGRVDEACALTVAMNPSAGEFRGRGWPQALSADALTNRLLRYFTNPQTPPHPWFGDSERVLRSLGLQYASNLTHLDVVPRATRTVTRSDGPAFLRLAEADAWVLFAALDLATAARLVILTGSVTNAYYLHEWVARRAPDFGWALADRPRRIPGGPFAAFHSLKTNGRAVPVFFTSASVNHRQGALHYERLVLAHRDTLLAHLNSAPT